MVNGVIKTVNGKPVSGVRVTVKANHARRSETVSNPDGTYRIENLSPGTYTIHLDPLKSGFAAGVAMTKVGKEGLTIDWVVSANAPGLAVGAPLSRLPSPDSGFWSRDGGIIGEMDIAKTLSGVEE